MNIALIGYGKMGKAIEAIAIERNHRIVLTIDADNQFDFTTENIQKADVAIEFTSPHTAFENVTKCLKASIPVVCGSTGWNEKIKEASETALLNQTAFIVASNFSLGVNLFFALNEKLAHLMNNYTNYKTTIEEIHHTQKKDAPSGTAISLAEQIINNNPHYHKWVKDSNQKDQELPIISKRIDPAPGTHIVKYSSEIDDIEIIHTAHNRSGFALGAVLAAEFIQNKQGIFTMKDVLGI